MPIISIREIGAALEAKLPQLQATLAAGAATAGLGGVDRSQRAVLYQSGPAAWAAQAGSERTGGVSGFGRL